MIIIGKVFGVGTELQCEVVVAGDVEDVVEPGVVGVRGTLHEVAAGEVVGVVGSTRGVGGPPVGHVGGLAHRSIQVVILHAGVVAVEREARSDVDLHVAADGDVLVLGHTHRLINEVAVAVAPLEAFARGGTFVGEVAAGVLRTTVGDTEREPGREAHGVGDQVHRGGGSLIAVRIAVLLFGVHDLGADIQPLGYLRVERQVGVVALYVGVVRHPHGGVLAAVAQADVVVGAARAAVHVEVVALLERGLEEFLVRVGDTVGVERAGAGGGAADVLIVTAILPDAAEVLSAVLVEPVGDRFDQVLVVHAEAFDVGAVGVLLGQDAFPQLGEDVVLLDVVLREGHRLVPGEVVGVGHVDLVLRTGAVLGGDEDHAPGRAATVDGGGGGVLQDGDVLDVVGVDERKVGDFHAVDQDQRLVVAVDGTGTAETHRRGGAEVSRVVGDGQAGDDALETLRHVDDRLAAEGLLHVDRRDGAGQVDLLLRTETDDHGFIEELRVIGQDDVDHAAAGDGHLLGLVADAGELQGSVCGSVDGVAAIRVGRRARCRTDDHYVRSDDRLIVVVDDTTRDADVLSPHGSYCEEQCAHGRNEAARLFGNEHK